MRYFNSFEGNKVFVDPTTHVFFSDVTIVDFKIYPVHVNFRENVMSFDIMIRHYSKYTKEKELQLIKSLTEEIIMMLRQSGSRKKRQTNNYRFNPDSLNIGSTRKYA